MAIYFFDSSAVVKRYVDEPGSAWVRGLCDQTDPGTGEPMNLIAIGEITLVEVSIGGAGHSGAAGHPPEAFCRAGLSALFQRRPD